MERARVTRILSKIKEDEKKITEAADILQELQVETFGSMDKREKTDFILEQMRLCLAKLDYQRVLIISKKISGKFFEDVANQVKKQGGEGGREVSVKSQTSLSNPVYPKCVIFLLSTPGLETEILQLDD